MKASLSRTDRTAVLWINILCVLLPLALLLGFLYAARPRSTAGSDTDLLYTVTLSPVRREHVGGIAANTPVLDAVSKREIGLLVDYTITQAMTQSYSRRAGRLRMVEYPGYVTVQLTVRARGKAQPGGYSLAGFSLCRGTRVSLRLPNFVGTGVCTALHATPISTKEPLCNERAAM